MVTWSPEEVDTGIQSLLIQFYPILLATLLSINRRQLSTDDTRFALILSSSPLTVHLVVASIGDIFGIQTGLYKQIKSHRLITRTLGALVPLLWIGLSLTLTLSKSAFKDSSCAHRSLKNWLSSTIDFLVDSFVFPGAIGHFRFFFITPIILAIPWLGCLARRWPRVTADGRLSSERSSKLYKLWALMKCIWCVPVVIIANWPNLTPSRGTIGHNHKWCVYYLFAYLDVSWAYQVIAFAIGVSGKGYVLSYGQVCPLLCAVDRRMRIEYLPV